MTRLSLDFFCSMRPLPHLAETLLTREGEVLDPALQHEQLFRFQVVFPVQQQGAIMHLEGFALCLG